MSEERSEPNWIAQALERYERPLLRFATKLVGPSQAPDIVQETFLKLCAAQQEKVGQYTASWLFTVCRNQAMDQLRRRRQHEEPEAVEEIAASERSPSSSLERKQAATQVLSALEELPKRDRQVVELRFLGELSYREIAKATELTVSHVGVILHGALKEIRNKLSQEERQTLARRLS